MNSEFWTYFIFLLIIFVIIPFLIFLKISHDNIPFEKPRKQIYIDISRRRQPSYKECIEEWIIKNKDMDLKLLRLLSLRTWKESCEQTIADLIFWKDYKRGIYEKMLKEVEAEDINYPMFMFVFTRSQTRYKQVNYQKSAYAVDNVEKNVVVSTKELLIIKEKLSKIGYETTLEKYNSKEQRKLMTKDLKDKIKIRDNYTCQLCGKYMPDEVGLHIDHIVPIKKGGKSVESNLQVLCDKCNSKKSTNIM